MQQTKYDFGIYCSESNKIMFHQKIFLASEVKLLPEKSAVGSQPQKIHPMKCQDEDHEN